LAWGNLVNGVLSWMIFWPSGCLAGVSGWCMGEVKPDVCNFYGEICQPQANSYHMIESLLVTCHVVPSILILI
jgi:hypothetical protein